MEIIRTETIAVNYKMNFSEMLESGRFISVNAGIKENSFLKLEEQTPIRYESEVEMKILKFESQQIKCPRDIENLIRGNGLMPASLRELSAYHKVISGTYGDLLVPIIATGSRIVMVSAGIIFPIVHKWELELFGGWGFWEQEPLHYLAVSYWDT